MLTDVKQNISWDSARLNIDQSKYSTESNLAEIIAHMVESSSNFKIKLLLRTPLSEISSLFLKSIVGLLIFFFVCFFIYLSQGRGLARFHP